ncbi:MAG: hypothetical protein ACOX4F_07025 [Atopobiaceae bacterium]|jgi:hypothetical protein
MIDQLTVFLENAEGRLAKLVRSIAQAGINMQALTLADTPEYGVVRIICTDALLARAALEAEGYSAMVTKVAAVEVPNKPGGLADLLGILDELDIPVEYGYCFSAKDERAIDILKIKLPEDATAATSALEKAGFRLLDQEDIAQM